MLDIGAPELFIVAVLAIIVVGPKELPKLIRSVMGMVKKVRAMGSDFQAGVKKMADEVELDAVTRKLNEAVNLDLDGSKKTVDKSADTKTDFSDYEEFDYDEYDYDGGGYSAPKKSDEKSDDAEDAQEQSSEDAQGSEEAPVETPAEALTETSAETPVAEKPVDQLPLDLDAKTGKKSKSKDDE